jgi:hypothetical protein
MDEPNDPNDPFQPLGDEDRALLRRDLVDVQVLKEMLEPKGIKGAMFFCGDCEEDHYLAWDLLAGNLRELLDGGESPVHEPAFNPDPDDYVSWDYARGFLDGYESFEHEEMHEVTTRLVEELLKRGLRPDEIPLVLAAAGLQVPGPEDTGTDAARHRDR